MTFIMSVVRALGPIGCAAALFVLYYEGAPGINTLPFVDQIPFVREYGVGRVELERRAAVKGMVKEAELLALQAKLDKERLRQLARDQSLTEARNRALASDRAQAQSRQAHAARVTKDRASQPRKRAILTEEDIQWLDAH